MLDRQELYHLSHFTVPKQSVSVRRSGLLSLLLPATPTLAQPYSEMFLIIHRCLLHSMSEFTSGQMRATIINKRHKRNRAIGHSLPVECHLKNAQR
jgi:hypothetical protein